MGLSLGDVGGWRTVLGRIVEGDSLTRDEAYAVCTEILSGEASPAQIGALLVGLRQKGETAEEMCGFVDAMLDNAEPLDVGGDLVDTCGTGGDHSGSINVSTIAAFVVAGAGVKVCKHGNRAQTSRAGSADVLEALGVAVDLGPDGVAACIEEAGMGFCLAPRFHPAMRHAGPVRKELGIPTVFNFLGPLANPARVPYQVIGVSSAPMAEKMARVLLTRGVRRAMVVYGHDGLDELSTVAPSTVLDVEPAESQEIRQWNVDPGFFDVERAEPDALRGGDAADNARHARAVLDGDKGPHRDIVLLNAAAAFVVTRTCADLSGGMRVAAKSIDSGEARAVLERLVAVSGRAAGAAR